ncbi:CNH domain-containing protein [Dichotomocladium elegans]|nr:CNH domain-containing protein [Dichotomocladium elegans]
MKVLNVHTSFQNQKYPALLSQVAQMLQERVTVETKIKDSIEYKDAFDGKEAVDKLCLFIGTSDRNLALLLGRTLDAQKFFHDVNYEHRLRDSSHELYQFKQHINYGQKHRLASPGVQEEDDEEDEKSEFNFMDTHAGHNEKDDDRLPNGVFTPLTPCYSPTCTRNNLCYSVFCPRRVEQVSTRQAIEPQPLIRFALYPLDAWLISCLFLYIYIYIKDDDRLWINTVPKHIANKLSSAEKKRQENIFELIYTERDFVNDLAYVIKYWINPLLETDVIPEEYREALVRDLFWNIKEVYAVNSCLADSLEERQKMSPVVEQIGDIMLQHVAFFGPFVQYGSHQMIARYVLETEKAANQTFLAFVEATERLPQSRKLELNGYLTKPTTRLGRYTLLLREILKHTPEGHPDRELIPKAMNVISEFLSDVNYETGKMENKFSLQLLREKLAYKAPLAVDERLSVNTRRVIMKGPLKRKGSGPAESTDLQVYLLDHCLLIVKPKIVNNVERYKIYKKPIPLALLAITLPDQQSRRASSILSYGRPSLSNSISSLNNIDAIAVAAAATSTGTNKGYPITFSYLGRSGLSPMTLYAPTLLSRRQWLDMIQTQRQALTEAQKVFDIRSIDARFFNSFNRVTCATSYGTSKRDELGKSVVLGSDQGVYMKHEDSKTENLRRLLPMEKVSQIDVLEKAGLILVLAEKSLYTYSLESLLAEDSAKRGRKLSSHVSLFKVGTVFQGTPSEKTLVCYVRVNTMQSTIRALEPHVSAEKKSRNKLSKLMRGSGTGGGGEGLKVYKDMYIPGEASSLQYFKSILCVGSPKGFQMVDLVSAEVQSVLDPSDESHKVLLHKENLRPITMFRHQNSSILLCYNELAFYIDKKGRRLRPEWSIRWEGQPTAFAVSYPYIVAFDPTFIEVRDMNTGDLVQIIPGKNVRCLKPDAQDTTIYCAMDDPVLGTELIFELIRV